MRKDLAELFRAPPLRGWMALVGAVIAVGIPTSLRAAVEGVVTGCEFTPYLPFVLASAIILGWRLSVLVAMASVAVMGGLFVTPANEHVSQSCFISGAGIFLGSSALIIGAIVAIRQVAIDLKKHLPDETADGIIFSLEKGEVWASWHGNGPPLRLGSKNRVGAMMEDFLAQVKLGERLKRKRD